MYQNASRIRKFFVDAAECVVWLSNANSNISLQARFTGLQALKSNVKGTKSKMYVSVSGMGRIVKRSSVGELWVSRLRWVIDGHGAFCRCFDSSNIVL